MATPLFRRLLWVAALFNVFGACVLGFPGSALGQMAGLPADVPTVYRVVVDVFVLLFGGSYAWLATQHEPNRPMVVLAALGKTSVFVAFVVLWLAGELTSTSVALASGDLAFAALFVWWLSSSKPA